MSSGEFFRILWLSMKARHPRLVKEMTSMEIELEGIAVRKEAVTKSKDAKNGEDEHNETGLERV